jgi:hypothetical protein
VRHVEQILEANRPSSPSFCWKACWSAEAFWTGRRSPMRCRPHPAEKHARCPRSSTMPVSRAGPEAGPGGADILHREGCLSGAENESILCLLQRNMTVFTLQLADQRLGMIRAVDPADRSGP